MKGMEHRSIMFEWGASRDNLARRRNWFLFVINFDNHLCNCLIAFRHSARAFMTTRCDSDKCYQLSSCVRKTSQQMLSFCFVFVSRCWNRKCLRSCCLTRGKFWRWCRVKMMQFEDVSVPLIYWFSSVSDYDLRWNVSLVWSVQYFYRISTVDDWNDNVQNIFHLWMFPHCVDGWSCCHQLRLQNCRYF